MKSARTRKLGNLSALALVLAVALGGFLGLASDAGAQSRFGCSALDAAHVPSIDGLDGYFFRISPDLANHNSMTDEVVAEVAAISAAMSARGTELIFVPLATKAQVLPAKLGPEAEKYVYDADLAATIYDAQRVRLSAAGVAVVDARRAFLASDDAHRAFFKTDPRLTNDGLRILAKAIADLRLDWPLAGGKGYVTTRGEPVVLDSIAHDVLQLSCLSELPSVETADYKTVAQSADDALDAPPRVVFAGPSEIVDASLNFDGFLSEVSGERVDLWLAKSSFSALTAYLTSEKYRQSPPEVLIWAVPVWENLALGGDQPFREAVAAIEDVCVSDLDAEVAGPDRLRVALGEATFNDAQTLMIENAGAAGGHAVFNFVGMDGQMRSRTVVRPADVARSGRFYMPLTGLWDAGVSHVDIETPLTESALPVVALCRGAAG
ncbi:alginate O-acetyltransferase AlgX-related protein [Boseongicola aestuarii]|uniref:Alginate biosynthesis protein AlgX n=1 Tax=Boseongicola aestuarii TaxID=1470561 RepID=A0A238J053_9RHOB|nr:hypothetical protein [Boseongicola aestuarii]SMX24016.1 Alginate biosynthesis protein AlgX precursor [Boseongicola aestuarii]